MKASDKAIELIKSFEKYMPEIYNDAVGIPTIGYGHVVRKNERELYATAHLTEGEATALLCADLEHTEAAITDLVTVDIDQDQFDALCSLVFNIGAGAFEGSTLLKKLNAGDAEGAQAEFARWNKAGGKELAGLTRRREAEAAMFMEA